MGRMVVYPSETAQWYALVNDTAAYSGNWLSEDIESYLVFLLQRFNHRPEVVASVLCLELLEAYQTTGEAQRDQLREVGDKCLLFSGLFPGLADRRHVTPEYFVQLGQGAYMGLAERVAYSESMVALYTALGEEFVVLVDFLHAMRHLGGGKDGLPFSGSSSRA